MNQRGMILIHGRPYCLVLSPDNDDGIAEWEHIQSLMRALYEDRLIDPDMVIIHPDDSQTLLEILFRAGVLVQIDPKTGQEVQAESIEVPRIRFLANVATGKVMPVSEKADATPGQLVLAMQKPWQIVGILRGLKRHQCLA